MRVWTTNDFRGHWPVGAAGVIVAEDKIHAKTLFDMALAIDGLDSSNGYTLIELDLDIPHPVILVNGEY